MSELSRSRISGLSDYGGQRDDAASAYMLCPLNLSSSRFRKGVVKSESDE